MMEDGTARLKGGPFTTLMEKVLFTKGLVGAKWESENWIVLGDGEDWLRVSG